LGRQPPTQTLFAAAHPPSSLSAKGIPEVLLAKLGERPRFKRSINLLLLEKSPAFSATRNRSG
jgi:hypothetical protein